MILHAQVGTGNLGDFSNCLPVLSGIYKEYGKILDLQNYYPDMTYQDIHNYDSSCKKQLPEDNVICRLFRSELEQHGIKFCTCELVEKFSIEGIMSSEWLGKSLGFHGKHGIASYYNVTI